MLSPATLQSLAKYTCPRCAKPLGRFHCYPIQQPGQVISLCLETAPMHKQCAEILLEALLTPSVQAIAIIKATPTSPSARLVRLHPEDATTTCLHLFTPEDVHFIHSTPCGAGIITRRATNEEVFQWMQPAIEDAMRLAVPGSSEIQELALTLGMIQKRWINKTDPKPATSANPA